MAIRYICISDLHLGAAYSLLTSVDRQGVVTPGQPCPALSAFANALNALLAKLPVNSRTRIVLLGDVLDMGFSDMAHVVKSFRRFADEFLTARNVAKLSPDLLYLPGNHDHQIWRDEKSQHLLRQIQEGSADESLFEVTKLLAPDFLESQLLCDILRTDKKLKRFTVQIAYPNFAEMNDQRAVVMHHGHYTESTYLAMSILNQTISGAQELPTDIAEIERQNGSWINFLWSNLGNAGFGLDALTMYQTMLDPGASHEMVIRAAARLSNWVADRFGTSDKAVSAYDADLTLNQLARAALDIGYGRTASTERADYRSVLSSSSVERLKWYLSGPVKEQFNQHSRPPKNLTFIFGHTHKPFQDQLPVDAYEAPVKVFNTGGWCVDKPESSPLQGAAAVFVDDELNVATLRMFNFPLNEEVAPTSAQGAGGYGAEGNPMLKYLAEAVNATSDEWASFTEVAKVEVERRQSLAGSRFFEPGSTDGVRKRAQP